MKDEVTLTPINSISEAENEPIVLDHDGVHILGDLFTSNYKIGPVMKTITFRALDLDDAKARFDRFLSVVRGCEVQKVIALGHVQKFACDLDEEITKIRKKAQQQMG